MTNPTEDRAGYIAGLRQLADLLEANPDVPLPYPGSHDGFGELAWILVGASDENESAVRALTRMLPDAVQRPAPWSDAVTTYAATLAGLHLEVVVDPRQSEDEVLPI